MLCVYMGSCVCCVCVVGRYGCAVGGFGGCVWVWGGCGGDAEGWIRWIGRSVARMGVRVCVCMFYNEESITRSRARAF